MAEFKTVLVQVIYSDERTYDYELTFQSSTQGEGDLAMLEKQLCLKSTEIKDFVGKGGVCEFNKESVVFPGRWTDLGDNSPVKHKTFLRCTIGNKRKLSCNACSANEIEAESNQRSLVKFQANSSDVQLYASCSHDSEPQSGNSL